MKQKTKIVNLPKYFKRIIALMPGNIERKNNFKRLICDAIHDQKSNVENSRRNKAEKEKD